MGSEKKLWMALDGATKTLAARGRAGSGLAESQDHSSAWMGKSVKPLPGTAARPPPLRTPAQKEHVTTRPLLSPLGSSRKTCCLIKSIPFNRH